MNRLTELIDIDGMKIKTSKERPLSEQGLGEILWKLYELENLEDELGCPLDVVFKALKEGFYTQTMHHTKQDNTWLGINDLGYTKEIFCMYFDKNMANIETCVEIDLKDYGKTWWLKEDKQ